MDEIELGKELKRFFREVFDPAELRFVAQLQSEQIKKSLDILVNYEGIKNG